MKNVTYIGFDLYSVTTGKSYPVIDIKISKFFGKVYVVVGNDGEEWELTEDECYEN